MRTSTASACRPIPGSRSVTSNTSAIGFAPSMPRALFYRFYDALFAGKDYDREVGLVLGLGWGRDEAAHILEIGAGTGGHTEFFVRRGHRVLGVDTDQEMLALACEKRSRLPPVLTGRLGYFHGTVEDSPDEHYDLAAAMFNVVTYVPDV